MCDELSDPFHQFALAVGFLAASEGWLHDSERVKRAVYELYEAEVRRRDAGKSGD
jgi:hypothetical protein